MWSCLLWSSAMYVYSGQPVLERGHYCTSFLSEAGGHVLFASRSSTWYSCTPFFFCLSHTKRILFRVSIVARGFSAIEVLTLIFVRLVCVSPQGTAVQCGFNGEEHVNTTRAWGVGGAHVRSGVLLYLLQVPHGQDAMMPWWLRHFIHRTYHLQIDHLQIDHLQIDHLQIYHLQIHNLDRHLPLR